MIEKDLLKDFPIFSQAPQDSLSDIAQIAEVRKLESDQTIFRDGDKANHLYGVINGEIELSITLIDKILKTDIQYEESVHTRIETIENDIIVESIHPNEIFGWSAFINPRLYTTNAKCSKPGTIISLPTDKLKSIYTNNPQVGYAFMERLSEIISQRLRNRTEKLIESWHQAFAVNRI